MSIIKDYYEIDENGFPTKLFRLNSIEEDIPKNVILKWTSRMVKPKYSREEKKWIETAKEWEILGYSNHQEMLDGLKNKKIEELRAECSERIIDGFIFEGNTYKYSLEKQINFQDTFQLFSNNIITEITWNVHTNNEKQRIKLNKEQFQKVYLVGIKHKTDILSRLNDVLIPMVMEAKNKETVARIYWDEGLDSPEISMKEDKTLEKQIDSLDKTTKNLQSSSMTTMMALVQVSNMIGK